MTKVIRVHKSESAFIYAILEAQEGLVNFSTLGSDFRTHPLPYRDLELRFTPEFSIELNDLLGQLKNLIYVLPNE